MRLGMLPLLCLLSACASNTVDDANQVSLYQEFQAFRLLVAENRAMAIEVMVSDEHAARIEYAQENMPKELRGPYFQDLANKIPAVDSHFEAIESDRGCLTINGLDDRQRPKSLSLYYMRENGRWVFDSIMVALHKSIDDYYREAVCPSIGQ